MKNQQELINYIKAHNCKTMYIKKSIADLSSFNVPSSGYRPNITGMRNLYWGHDAIIALQSGYAYLLEDKYGGK